MVVAAKKEPEMSALRGVYRIPYLPCEVAGTQKSFAIENRGNNTVMT